MLRILLLLLVGNALLISTPSLAAAQDSSVTLTLAGEAYDGPPAFTVTFNGQTIGKGAVKTAIDTIIKGRLVTNNTINGTTERFQFNIPSAIFDPNAPLDIYFTNDKFDTVNKIGDRNLYVVSANINGREVPASDFATLLSDSPTATTLISGMLFLPGNTTSARAAAPPGGWPQPTPPAPMRNQPGPSTEPASPAKASELNKGRCTQNLNVTIDGYQQNGTSLTVSQMRELGKLVVRLGTEKCSIKAVGYSDAVGPVDANTQMAHDRAAGALDYLTSQGVNFQKTEVVGFGPTHQFGPTSPPNRRVVLTIAP